MHIKFHVDIPDMGAGAILRSSTGEVSGHTTAASLWAMSAIGMAVGSGHELLGILLALVLYAIIAISEWPLLMQLRQYLAQREAQAARRDSDQSTVNGPSAVNGER